MKCRKCRRELDKNAKFCKYCGFVVKEKGKWKLIGLLSFLILIFGAMFGASLLYFMKTSDSPESYFSQNNQENEDETEWFDLDLVGLVTAGNPGLKLYISADDVIAGKQSRVSFVVQVPDYSYDEAVIVREDNGSILLNLTKQRVTGDGMVELYGNYTFVPEKNDFIKVRAYSGGQYSPMGFISVIVPVSDEANEEFVNVFTDLADYVAGMDKDFMSNSEVLDAVDNWLKNNEGVAEINREEQRIYYQTTGGIESYFTVEADNPFVAGSSSADSYENDTDTVENYDQWKENKNIFKNNSEGNITYDFSDITITNNNTLLMRPTYDADDGFKAQYFDTLIIDAVKGSEHLEGGKVNNCKTPGNVLDVIKDGELLDYGNIFLGAHGGNDGNYLFRLVNFTEKKDWKNFYSKYKNLITAGSSEDAAWSIRYYQDKEGHYRAQLSARYIMNVYQNATFDNAIFWMISCEGMSDQVFNEFLIDHGAQCIIGSDESVYFRVMNRLLDTVLKDMLEKDNNEAKLSNAWNSGVDENGKCWFVGSGTIRLSAYDYLEYYKEVYSVPETNVYDNIIKNSSGDDADMSCRYITDENMVREYLEYLNPDWEDLHFIKKALTESEDGTFEYTVKYVDILQYKTRNGDFTYGGHGALSGIVSNGNTVRTIHKDGSFEDNTTTKDSLAYANVTAYRFLDQTFLNKDINTYSDEATTDGNGRFVLNDLDWGLYAIEVDYSSYEGEASIILTDIGTDGGEIVAYSGKSAISGYIQGYTNEERTRTKNLKGAVFRLQSVDKINGEMKQYGTFSDSDGYFEITGIEAGTYRISISHEDYEDYASILAFKKGYEYRYEEGYFVLENDISSTDVVLVLDTSGSMDGTPLRSLQTAVDSFADSMLGFAEGKNCRVAVVSFSDNASSVCGFTKYQNTIYEASSALRSTGGTNMEAGLQAAYSLLESGKAEKKIIVLMSDGQPNRGREGDSLISYASEIKADGITIYTQGFFSELGNNKASAQSLMDALAGEGYHYEVDSADELIDFYDDMANQISGQRYDHIRIACPVDVSVTYKGETLNSSEDSLCTRTSFGTLTFETAKENDEGDTDDRVKILRLKSGVDYDLTIIGIGKGTMNYTVSYPDEDGNYSDIRKFRNVKVSENTVIDTTVGDSKVSVLNVDNDGDGKYDIRYKAGKNEYGKETGDLFIIYVVMAGITVLVILAFIIILIIKRKNSRRKVV